MKRSGSTRANSVVYRFTVPLPVSAERAYRWSTDYRPDDPARMGEDGRRTVEWIADDAVVLTDAVRSGRRTVVKRRLVRLRPNERAWINTHIGGPLVHSQYLYRIVPRGPRASRLEFTGLQVEYGRAALSSRERAERARECRRHDRAAWTHLVRSMKADLLRGR